MTQIAVVYPTSEDAIATLRERYTGLSADTPKGYEEVRVAIGELRKLRVAVEERRKELKKDSLEYGRRVDSVAKALTDQLEAIENPLKLLKEAADEEKARAKAEKEAAERRAFEEQLRAEAEAREARLAEIRAQEEARLRAEAEQLAQERAAFEAEERERAAAMEAQRLEAERQEAERQRLAQIEREQIEAERRRVAEEQAAIAAERQRLADEQAAAEARAKEELRQQQETLAAERAEIERQREEMARQAEEEAAQREHARLAIEQQERERVARQEIEQRAAQLANETAQKLLEDPISVDASGTVLGSAVDSSAVPVSIDDDETISIADLGLGPNYAKICEHEKFKASVDVTRLTSNGSSDPTSYTAEIRIHCAACGVPMKFLGLSSGSHPEMPTVSFDGLELRCPVFPSPAEATGTQAKA